jgi:hypothetical protein
MSPGSADAPPGARILLTPLPWLRAGLLFESFAGSWLKIFGLNIPSRGSDVSKIVAPGETKWNPGNWEKEFILSCGSSDRINSDGTAKGRMMGTNR